MDCWVRGGGIAPPLTVLPAKTDRNHEFLADGAVTLPTRLAEPSELPNQF